MEKDVGDTSLFELNVPLFLSNVGKWHTYTFSLHGPVNTGRIIIILHKDCKSGHSGGCSQLHCVLNRVRWRFTGLSVSRVGTLNMEKVR